MLFPKVDLEHYNTLFSITSLDVHSCFFRQIIMYDHMDYPAWLRNLVFEMQKKANYTRGLQAMCKYSNFRPSISAERSRNICKPRQPVISMPFDWMKLR